MVYLTVSLANDYSFSINASKVSVITLKWSQYKTFFMHFDLSAIKLFLYLNYQTQSQDLGEDEQANCISIHLTYQTFLYEDRCKMRRRKIRLSIIVTVSYQCVLVCYIMLVTSCDLFIQSVSKIDLLLRCGGGVVGLGMLSSSEFTAGPIVLV